MAQNHWAIIGFSSPCTPILRHLLEYRLPLNSNILNKTLLGEAHRQSTQYICTHFYQLLVDKGFVRARALSLVNILANSLIFYTIAFLMCKRPVVTIKYKTYPNEFKPRRRFVVPGLQKRQLSVNKPKNLVVYMGGFSDDDLMKNYHWKVRHHGSQNCP